jgi:hypothetical protein
MSGYTPVFRSVFEGTLCGQYPDTAAWLFLLALADKNGHVDKTPQYISAVTGMPVADLVGCIERFMEPDAASRSGAEEGRRLVPIDPERSWGWKIVNHEKYREKARKAASDAERVASGRDAERKRLERERQRDVSRAVPRSPAESRAVRLSDADADTDSDKLRSDSGSTLSASESDRANQEALIAIENRKRLKQLTAAAVKTVPRRGA